MRASGTAILLLALAATSPARAQKAETAYQVQAGDTLYGFGQRYLSRPADYRELQRLNRVRDPRRLHVGRTLRVPDRLLRTEPVTARLAAFRGTVTITGPSGSLTPRAGMLIGEGLRLETAQNSFLTVELADGSRVTLPSLSRMEVGRLRRVVLTGAVQRDFHVAAGRSSAVVTPARKGDEFTIRTPQTVAAVRGTEFRVRHDPAERRSAVEVVEGVVAAAPVEDTAAGQRLTAGFGAQATAAGVEAPRALLAAPSVNRSDLRQDEPTLTFRLHGPEGARRFRGQLAADAGFIDLFAETESETGTVAFPSLPNGSYFARFTVLDEAGLEGLPAVYAFERRLNAVGLEAPSAIEGGGRRYLFRWRAEGEGVAVYRFTLTRDEAGERRVIDLPGLEEDRVVITDLDPGVYYWRVTVSRFEGGARHDKPTPAQRFEIGR